MIYKFIDINGSEISVNSISSLQALVDSETIKENTKVKAGLRGKWTTASNIEELNFNQEAVEDTVETMSPEVDIKSFITVEEKPEEITVKEKFQETSAQPWQSQTEKIPVETTEDINDIKDDDNPVNESQEEKRDERYDDENVVSINFFDAIKICFNKYLAIEGRASRSEYWWFFLFTIIFDVLCELVNVSMGYEYGEFGMFFFISLVTVIPMITVTARRLHDVDKSGWWMLISLTIIGVIPLFIWTISKGVENKNRFGKYPLKLKK